MLAAFLGLPVLLLAIGAALLKDFWIDTLGIGRKLDLINNANCIKIPELEACEDSWLHQESGLLYLACSTLQGRKSWVPAIDHLTAPLPGDYVAIYDTRSKGPPSSRITKVEPQNFHGIKGEGQLNLHSIGVHVSSESGSDEKPTLRIFLNNHRPFLDSNGVDYLSGKDNGANSTVELFETVLGSSSMKHIRTYSNPLLVTPNMVAPVDEDSFLVTNDHAEKVGLLRGLDLLMPKSHIVYCDTKGCKNATKNKLAFPNGLIKSHERNVYYQASSAEGIVRSYELQADKTLSLLDEIHTGYPADNLNLASDGSVLVAGFPSLLSCLSHFSDPIKKHSPTVALRITLNTDKDAFFGKKYKVEKLFEDDGNVASGITVATYDVEKKKLFLSGVMSPQLTECQL